MKDGGPAFPCAGLVPVDGTLSDDGQRQTKFFVGLSVRDYFAAAALQAIVNISSPKETAASYAYQYADAMLAERERKERT